MPVINTSEDLLRLLDENAEFREAARRHILTDELIRLPERFAQFAARIDGFIEEQREVNAEQRGINQRVDGFIEEQQAVNVEQTGFNQRVDGFIEEQRAINQRVDGFIEEQRAINQRVDGFIEEQRATNQRVDGFIEEQRATNRRVETAIGELRGNVARQIVGMYRREISAGLDLVYQRALDRHELFSLLPPLATSDISPGDWHSFYRADLVLEATGPGVDVHYVAIEASYTADRRDTDRASRNATLLERFKQRPAHAVIASVRNDYETQALVDNHSIGWYALDPADFTPD